MTTKTLKQMVAPAPEAAPARERSTMTSTELLRVATGAAHMPPAVMRTPRKPVMFSIKITPELADALADRAAAEGISQKLLVTRALVAAGLPVPDIDLEDRTRRRRRAA
jgi:hypothetical protein